MSYGRRGRRDASSRSSSPYKLQNCKLKVKYASLQSARARAINTPPKSRDYTLLSSITLEETFDDGMLRDKKHKKMGGLPKHVTDR